MASLTTRIGTALGLALLGSASPTPADDWPWPQEREVASPSGTWKAWLLLEDPRKTGGFRPRMRLTGPGGSEMVFPLVNKDAPVELVVLDDGTLVTCDDWHRRGAETAVAIYQPGGRLVAAHSLERLIGPKEYIPASVSSTHWLRQPFEWQEKGTGAERSLALTLFNEDRLLLRLHDGQPRYQVVEEVGDDAARLLQRAKSLHPGEEVAEKIVLLRRALALDRQLDFIYYELAEPLCNTSRKACEEAVVLLDQGLANFPPKACGHAGCSDPGLWMATYKGRTLARLGRFDEAKAELRRVLAIDPAFRAASESLAQLETNPRPETFPEEKNPPPFRMWLSGISRQEFLRRALAANLPQPGS